MVALRRKSSDHLSVAEFLAWDSGDRCGRCWRFAMVRPWPWLWPPSRMGRSRRSWAR